MTVAVAVAVASRRWRWRVRGGCLPRDRLGGVSGSARVRVKRGGVGGGGETGIAAQSTHPRRTIRQSLDKDRCHALLGFPGRPQVRGLLALVLVLALALTLAASAVLPRHHHLHPARVSHSLTLTPTLSRSLPLPLVASRALPLGVRPVRLSPFPLRPCLDCSPRPLTPLALYHRQGRVSV